MASGPPSLTGGYSAPLAFAQQGRVDWAALGNTAWKMTSAMLLRLSTAEIQPATYGAAIAFGCRFKLGTMGNRRVENAIQQMQGSPSIRKLLWFGFGYKSFVHVLSETQAGLNCMALCACLAESHGQRVAGEVLSALWHTCGFPEAYEPSQAQFAHLIKACEGLLANSSFGTTFVQMANLRNLVSGRSGSNDCGPRQREMFAEPRNTAVMLCALFDISNNEVESIDKAESFNIAGDVDWGFIHAIAQFLLDFEVCINGTIEIYRDGRLLTSGNQQPCDSQYPTRDRETGSRNPSRSLSPCSSLSVI